MCMYCERARMLLDTEARAYNTPNEITFASNVYPDINCAGETPEETEKREIKLRIAHALHKNNNKNSNNNNNTSEAVRASHHPRSAHKHIHAAHKRNSLLGSNLFPENEIMKHIHICSDIVGSATYVRWMMVVVRCLHQHYKLRRRSL